MMELPSYYGTPAIGRRSDLPDGSGGLLPDLASGCFGMPFTKIAGAVRGNGTWRLAGKGCISAS